MRERTTPTRSVSVDAMCETCDMPMEWTRRELSSHPPQYPHRCPKCDKVENLRNVYPMMRFVCEEPTAMPTNRVTDAEIEEVLRRRDDRLYRTAAPRMATALRELRKAVHEYLTVADTGEDLVDHTERLIALVGWTREEADRA